MILLIVNTETVQDTSLTVFTFGASSNVIVVFAKAMQTKTVNYDPV